jgi:hypothetical protein
MYTRFGAALALCGALAMGCGGGAPVIGGDQGGPGHDMIQGGDGQTMTPDGTGGGHDGTGNPDDGPGLDQTGNGDGTSNPDGPPVDGGGPPDGGPGPGAIKTIFVIVMENTSWEDITGSDSAPFINGTLVPMASHAENYTQPMDFGVSEPEYIWMEAGDNLGITTDDGTDVNSQDSTMHLVNLIEAAGKDWRSYQEDIDGTTCPIADNALYASRHNPFVYFNDVTDSASTTAARCIQHVRPFTELATDLSSGTVAAYNFITPNLCHDMHGSQGVSGHRTDCARIPGITDDNLIGDGDTWLQTTVQMITASQAYQQGGAIFITWDEKTEFSSGLPPIGMIVLSPFAKGNGYSNTTHYDHSSLLRTVQEILGVSPLLGAAASATSLSDLFSTYP